MIRVSKADAKKLYNHGFSIIICISGENPLYNHMIIDNKTGEAFDDLTRSFFLDSKKSKEYYIPVTKPGYISYIINEPFYLKDVYDYIYIENLRRKQDFTRKATLTEYNNRYGRK